MPEPIAPEDRIAPSVGRSVALVCGPMGAVPGEMVEVGGKVGGIPAGLRLSVASPEDAGLVRVPGIVDVPVPSEEDVVPAEPGMVVGDVRTEPGVVMVGPVEVPIPVALFVPGRPVVEDEFTPVVPVLPAPEVALPLPPAAPPPPAEPCANVEAISPAPMQAVAIQFGFILIFIVGSRERARIDVWSRPRRKRRLATCPGATDRGGAQLFGVA